ncbi:hypothetical protein Q0N12_17240 [Rossellomorea marisflavi]
MHTREPSRISPKRISRKRRDSVYSSVKRTYSSPFNTEKHGRIANISINGVKVAEEEDFLFSYKHHFLDEGDEEGIESGT